MAKHAMNKRIAIIIAATIVAGQMPVKLLLTHWKMRSNTIHKRS